MAGPIRIAILANGRQARSELARTGSAFGKIGGLAKTGLAAGGFALLALGKSAVSAEAKFSTSMNLIQAATKAPASEMGKLNDLAIKLGAETSFSAGEAADAMLELAKAGLDTKTIMGGGLAGTLQLAAAGGTELGAAATIASNALNTFNLRGEDMAKVAAALAGGANASSASVESLGQALQQVGPGATNAGLSLQETVAALSAFDAAGVKGSDAGTSLKTMLARLVPSTDKAKAAMKRLNLDFTKGNGEFVSLTNISEQLKRNLGRLSAEQRTLALNTVFGSDASRAATILMKEGASGIQDFIKATNDQSAAQEMAEARMKGTAGAMERLSGAAETAKLRLGQELAPVVQKGADLLADRLGPAMEDGIDAAKAFARAVSPLVDVMGDLVRIAGDAVGFLKDLPGPVKEIGIQAGIAALVLPKLTGAAQSMGSTFTTTVAKVKQINAELSYTATRGQRAKQALAAAGSAARGAAGIGGMLALAQGAQTSNKALGALANIGGGAMLGFAAGGPIGAAIGAGAGGLKTLWDMTRKSSGAMSNAKRQAEEYATQIDRIAAASGRARRAEILRLLQMDGEIIPAARTVGIETNKLVAALGGNDKALRQINRQWENNSDLLNGLNLDKVKDFLTEQGFELRRSESSLADNRRALEKWGGAVKEQTNKVKPANEALGKLGRVSPDNKWLRDFAGQLTTATGESRKGAARVRAELKSGTAKADANLGPFISSLQRGVDTARNDASSGGREIGSALGAGIDSGIDSWINNIVSAARNAVNQAISAAKAEAKSKSPSRRTFELGEDIGKGLELGMRARERQVAEAGRRMAGTALTGVAGRGLGFTARDAFTRSTAANRATPAAGRMAFTITNWRDGTGYFEQVADGRVASRDDMTGARSRATYGGTRAD